MRKVLILTALSLLALALSAVAFASPSALLDEYSGLAGVQQGVAGQGVKAGTLPFTGLDLGLVVGGGMLLLLTGWTLRRAGRDKA
ncbi:MAG TPA: hypothetical protein VIM23_11680 [Gaiellaceae bacterium]